jgi:hypothetical protein
VLPRSYPPLSCPVHVPQRYRINPTQKYTSIQPADDVSRWRRNARVTGGLSFCCCKRVEYKLGLEHQPASDLWGLPRSRRNSKEAIAAACVVWKGWTFRLLQDCLHLYLTGGCMVYPRADKIELNNIKSSSLINTAVFSSIWGRSQLFSVYHCTVACHHQQNACFDSADWASACANGGGTLPTFDAHHYCSL